MRFFLIPLLFISTLAFTKEVYLHCENDPSIRDIFIETSTLKGSIEMNERVLHKCDVTASPTEYIFLCPSLKGGFDNWSGSVNRKNLNLVESMYGNVKIYPCELIEVEDNTIQF